MEAKGKGAKSLQPERLCPPKSVYVHVTSMSTCMNFLSQFQSIKFFGDHGLQKIGPWSMVRKGNLAVFEGNSISETGEGTPTKIDVLAFDINPYLHKFFEPIPTD